MKLIVLPLAVLTLLSGCTQGPPKCSDEATFDVLRQIIIDKVGRRDGTTDDDLRNNIKFELPRASGFDEKIKKYSCEAKMVIAEQVQMPIAYESQLNDQNQHIVSLDGISLGDWIQLEVSIYKGIDSDRAKGKATSKPSESPAEQVQSSRADSAQGNQVETGSASPQVAEPAAQHFTPSFNCAKTSTSVEKSICDDSLLGQLDGALADNYKMMKASDIGDGAMADLKATQKSWLLARNKCDSNECLESAYRKRLDEICGYPVISGVHPTCTVSTEIK